MKARLTSDLIVAYLQCPRKAALLLIDEGKVKPSEYVSIIQQRKIDNQVKYLASLRQREADIQRYSPDELRNGCSLLTDVLLIAEGCEAECGFLTKITKSSSLGDFSYEPTIFIGTQSINREHKLELGFVAYVLSRLQGEFPKHGRIISAIGAAYEVELEPQHKLLRPIMAALQEWLICASLQPPSIILNKHCAYCQFQKSCQEQAEREDNLSLLSGITRKSIQQYEKKGIFTIKQLSYLFKPRRPRKQSKKLSSTHNPELQALAIRTNKIYVHHLPSISRRSIELFLDIEGIPDRRLYYLIGLLICEGGTRIYHNFWADSPQDEERMWRDFIDKIGAYDDAPIYHYGNYELKTIEELSKRYDTRIDNINGRMINVNTYIYGKVYFPTRSNGLKDIGHFFGFAWSSQNASGLQSIIWRHHWDNTRDDQYKELLLTYNKEDCQSLELITDELSKIEDSANTLSEVDFVNQPKKYTSDLGEKIHNQFANVLEFAHSNYDKKKIKFRIDETNEDARIEPRKDFKKGYQGQRKTKLKATKIIQVQSEEVCPKDGEPLRPTKRTSSRLIIDLVLTRSGIKKTVTEYIGYQGYCPKCCRPFAPPDIRKYGANQIYGHGFQSWVVYQRVALRMTYGSIAEMMMEQFKEREPKTYIAAFIKNSSHYYVETEEIIIKHLLESPFIHADETPINVRGATQYVWTFTNDRYVVFKFSKTREATIAHEFLVDYKGVLISDFYPGYDSIPCRQQKCWVHLIRELNNDLWESPFDTEFEFFISQIRNLFVPIMVEVQKYGLKKRHLHKFGKDVEVFYNSVIIDKEYKSELAIKYQKRFVRYKESLFTFIEQDEIPWHNNTAERALRHVAKQQQISLTFSGTVIHDYLRLLSIRQTLRFQGKSFFRFLFSNEKNIDAFR